MKILYSEFLRKFNSYEKYNTFLDNSFEEKTWNRAQTLNTIKVYEIYLSKYPKGKYRTDALNRIKKKNLYEKLLNFIDSLGLTLGQKIAIVITLIVIIFIIVMVVYYPLLTIILMGLGLYAIHEKDKK